MKTNSDELLTKDSDTVKNPVNTKIAVARPSKSLRPMKSMVKSSSLRPQRIQVGAKLRRKAIKA